MGPKAKCSCTLHNEIIQQGGHPSTSYSVYNLKRGKKVPKHVFQAIVKEGHLSDRSTYLCSTCINFFQKDIEASVKNRKVEETLVDNVSSSNVEETLVDKVCSLLDNNEVSCEEAAKLACSLGRYIAKTEKPVSSSRDLESMELNCKQSIEECFGIVLVSLMNGLVISNNDRNKSVKTKMACEQICGLINQQYVGNVHYSLSLIAHYLTGSSNIVNILYRLYPTVHYTTLIQGIDSNNTEIEIPSSGDGVIFFDNNQILSRRWNVVYDCKSMVSVVTTLLFLQPPIDYELQKNPTLSPFLWYKIPEDLSFCHEKPEAAMLFKSYRNKFIAEVISQVYQEQSVHNGNITDEIDNLTPTETVTKPNLHTSPVSIVFDEHGKLQKLVSPKNDDPYDSVSSGVRGKPNVTLLDPVFKNPCSYDAVANIFDHISKISLREWIAVGCDGLPYLLGSRIIENYIDCPLCGSNFTKLSAFETHRITMHAESDISAANNRKFKNILLVPGLGHYEINYVKALFKMLWPLVLKELAKLMGYKSLKALSFCEAATNHHKSWSLLQICLEGCSKELVTGYVRDSLRKNAECSVAGYFNYISSGHSKKYQLMFRVIFDFLFALHPFRKAVRRNNKEVISCAMHQLSPLFYGLNMTSYMEIDVRRQTVEKESPPEVKQLLADMTCMSHSGHESKAEGCDFILEAYNKKTKMWMPPGAGTATRWLRVYRNLQHIEKLKHLYTLDDKEDEGFRKRDNANAVAHWRRTIRENKFLMPDSQFISMSGEELDYDLVNFDEKCATNRKRYCVTFPDTFKCERIFFTPDDRRKYHDISNKKKSEIASMITKCIVSIAEEGGDTESEVLLNVWKKEVKQGKKSQYLDFYKECIQALEQVSEEYCTY